MKQIKVFKHEIAFFLFFVGSRLPYLGHDIFNTDVWKWKARIFDFGYGVFAPDFAKTLQTYHPGVALMWLGSIGVKLYSFYYNFVLKITPPDNDLQAIFMLHFLQKLVIVLALGFTLMTVLYVLRKLFGTRYAWLVGLFFLFEPFYVGLTRVIHLEGLMSTFMVAAFVWFFYAFYSTGDFTPKPIKKYFIGAAFFSAIALLTKTSAIFLVPFFGLTLVLMHYSRRWRSLISPVSKNFAAWLGITVLFCIALWPALWVTPQNVVQTLYSGVSETGVEEGHAQIYFGNYVEDPGPLYYLVVFALRTSPYILLGMVGFIFFRKQIVADYRYKEVAQKFIIFAAIFMFFYTLQMTLPSKKLDRYLLPTILVSFSIAGFFFDYLLSKFKSKAAAIFLFLPAVLTFLLLLPDYLSYYNPLLGGTPAGIKILEPKWLIGQSEIRSFIIENIIRPNNYETFPEGASIDEFLNTSAIRNKLVIGFPEKYYTQIHPFIEEIGARATIIDITAQAVNTEYFIYPVWDDTSHDENRFELRYFGSVFMRGTEVYRVYQKVL